MAERDYQIQQTIKREYLVSQAAGVLFLLIPSVVPLFLLVLTRGEICHAAAVDDLWNLGDVENRGVFLPLSVMRGRGEKPSIASN
jgi:hypothetical protein